MARPGLAVEHERRQQDGGAQFEGDALSASYAYVAVRPGVAVDAGRVEGAATVEGRWESEPLGPTGREALADAARSITVEATGRVRGAVPTEARVAFRRKRYGDDFRLLGRQDAESVALRVASRGSVADGALDGRLVYDALTERAPILQETYVVVGQDLGEFVWRDGEGEPRPGEPDGVAQLDEFFPETTPLEGTYLRTFVPGTDLVPTVGVGLGLRLDARPGRLVPALGVVALRTTVDLRERTRQPDVLRVLVLDPGVLQRADADDGTVDGRLRVEQEVVLFPERPDRGGRVVGTHLRSTSRLAAGLEARLVQDLRAEAYAPLAGTLDGRRALVAGRRRARSDAFASRTYDLRTVGAEGSLRWAPSDRVAVTLAPTLLDRTDALVSGARPAGAVVGRVPVEVRWTRSGRFSVASRAEVSVVRLRGAARGLALFELTDGRGPGTSVLWGVDADLGLTDRLRGGLVYDGRAPATGRAVQTVRVQLSATL